MLNDLFCSLFFVENVENSFEFFLEFKKRKKQCDNILVFIQIFFEHRSNSMFCSFTKIRRREYCFVFVRDMIEFEIEFDLNQSCFQLASVFVEDIWFVDLDSDMSSALTVVTADVRLYFHSCTIAGNRGVQSVTPLRFSKVIRDEPSRWRFINWNV